jgi:lipoprotein-anchoring transpeptidase ErfK/SrfK
MAVRRTRTRTSPRTPPRKARGVLSWLLVLLVAGAVGWVWWLAAYGSPSMEGTSRSWTGAWWDRWRGTVEEEDIEDLPPVIRESTRPVAERLPEVRPRETPRIQIATPSEPPVFPTNPPVFVPPALAATTASVGRTEVPSARTEVPDDREGVAAKKEGTNVLGVQLALARRGISAGPIDGVIGSQTRAALRVFQKTEGLPVTGLIDERTLSRLSLGQPSLTNYVVTAEDVARLTWVPSTWLGKASRERLDYESILELVSEKNHAHPKLVRQLNPSIQWDRVRPGTSVTVPAGALPPLRGRAGFVKISLSEKALRVFDPASNLVAHFPCSIARKVEKRPVGELRVVRLAPNPNYRFDPEIFKESPEARKIGRKLMIPPGPNNPVGTAWIGLSRAGYGIHGTPHPEDVGRTESHGCFRLANWNAEFLVRAAWVGMPVFVEP